MKKKLRLDYYDRITMDYFCNDCLYLGSFNRDFYWENNVSLSEKLYWSEAEDGGVVNVEDVREAVKELRNRIATEKLNYDDLWDWSKDSPEFQILHLIDEIFGDKLI